MTDEINSRLREMLSACDTEGLRGAMEYSVFAGGKRIRPRLLLAACEAVNGEYNINALDFACAVEMIHTYSLIHDDMPCMDDDDLRRGMPACHIKFGEALALLAGDALLSLAVETMSGVCSENCAVDERGRYIRSMDIIIRAAGANGMVSGQAAELIFENKETDENTIRLIYSRKTEALIRACLTAGALLGGADRKTIESMAKLGSLIGYSFQILDDILDVSSTTEQLGKPAKSDVKNKKNTYVSAFGIHKARDEYERLTAEASALMDGLSLKTDSLRALTDSIIYRDR
jgi:geranylgeranyl diphosphate synthase type II